MAVLASADLVDLRQRYARAHNPACTKAQIDAALQAIEDAMQSTSNVGAMTLRAYIAQAVETAAPTIFTAQQKQDLYGLLEWLHARGAGLL